MVKTSRPSPEEVAEDLRQAVGHFVRHTRAQDGTGGGRTAVLGHLARQGPTSIASLAALEQVRHQSMARTVQLLVAAGHARTRPDPADGRRVVVESTPAGIDHLTAERGRRSAWIARAITTRLDEADQAALAALPGILRRLADG
jgi:DNA-binding MarR family transcriptional regulator